MGLGQLFIITGGGTGIGQALALNLAQKGEQVLIVGRREDPLIETSALSPRIKFIPADLSKPDALQTVALHACELSSQIKGLVHNAGTIMPIEPLMSIKRSSWLQTMATNLEPALFLTQALSAHMTDARVLNISSGAAHFPVVGWGAYCVSKAALSMLTRCWQLEASHFHVASVMPGIIDTDMQALIRAAKDMDIEKVEFFKKLKKNSQLLTKETVAAFLSWLLLDTSPSQFVSKEWDIYDTADHESWLKPPHHVPPLEVS